MWPFNRKKKETELNSENVGSREDLQQRLGDAFLSGGYDRVINSFFSGSKFSGALNYSSEFGVDHRQLKINANRVYWDSTHASSALNRLVENTINTGLRLESKPQWDFLKVGVGSGEDLAEAQKKWTKKTESLFHLWAKSKRSDVTERNTFYQNQALISLLRHLNGEVFIRLKYSKNSRAINPLQIQIIDCKNVRDPQDKTVAAQGNTIRHGIEFNSEGKEVAYYVWPNAKFDDANSKPVRVPKYGPRSGRRMMIHSVGIEGSKYDRGIPTLSKVIHELKKISDYSVSEIQAALINAIIAVWIKPSDTRSSSTPMKGVTRKRSDNYVDEETPAYNNVADFKKPGLIVQNLKAGEEIHSFDTKRPNVNYSAFVDGVMASISSSLSIPLSVLNEKFEQNYSASRAEIIMFWNKIKMERANENADINDPIFEAFLAGAVSNASIKAPGFGDSQLLTLAWSNASWTGLNQPNIDPSREAKAVSERIAQGVTTRQRESQTYNGSNYHENIEVLKKENEALREAFPEIAPNDSGGTE